MTSLEQIVIATSIPPRLSRVGAGRHVDGQYQQLCIQSWLDCGFRVLSVNDRDEVSHLQPLYPQVEFFLTERNASAICGRKNPFIVDLLSALLQSRASVIGIVNSDVVFEPVQAGKSGCRILPAIAW